MTETLGFPALTEAAESPRWRALLLSAGFIVDVANLSRDGGDLLDPLVFAAIVQANQASLRHDPVVQQVYGDSGEALPDELRRPISINAVAHSLRLPFETVRRRVRGLVQAGQCVVTPAGAYVPQAVIVGAAHARIQAERMARLMRLHAELADAGFLAREHVLPAPLPLDLKRTVNRALSEYMLRSCERVVELVPSVFDGFVLLGLGAANGEALLADPDEPPGPCSTRSLARRLGLPQETARRRLICLEAAGFARREPRGWLAAARPAEEQRLLRLAAENEADLRRLMARLRELSEVVDAASPRR
jgi:DNA-binding IclR family transcriptional regulator